MAKLIYSAITSLDGYLADPKGNFDWAAPDEEVHRFVNEGERSIVDDVHERPPSRWVLPLLRPGAARGCIPRLLLAGEEGGHPKTLVLR